MRAGDGEKGQGMGRKIELMPYCEIDGIRTMRDSDVMALFDRMEKDGVISMVFFDGSVKTREGFLYEMKFGGSYLYVVLIEGQEAGCVWLNRFEARTAHFNWCLFSEFWGMEDKADVAVRARDILIAQKNPTTGEYIYDAFLGLMRKDNLRAIQLAKLGGVVVIGEIPNGIWNDAMQKSEPGILVCYPRDGNAGEREGGNRHPHPNPPPSMGRE